MVKDKFGYPLKAVIFLVSLVCGLICFCSCATGVKYREDRPHAYLTDTSSFILLPTGAVGKSMDMAQRISASYQGRDFFMMAWVKADETVIEMTLLSEMGTTIGELSYRDELISFSSEVFPASLKPEYIIADFQLCFYDTVLLARALKNCGLDMESSGSARRVLRGKNLIYEIEKNNEEVRLTNHLRGYAYTLEGDFS